MRWERNKIEKCNGVRRKRLGDLCIVWGGERGKERSLTCHRLRENTGRGADVGGKNSIFK